MRPGFYDQVRLVDGEMLRVSTAGYTTQVNYNNRLFDRLLQLSDQEKIRDPISEIGIMYSATINAKYRDKVFAVGLFRSKRQILLNTTVEWPRISL